MGGPRGRIGGVGEGGERRVEVEGEAEGKRRVDENKGEGGVSRHNEHQNHRGTRTTYKKGPSRRTSIDKVLANKGSPDSKLLTADITKSDKLDFKKNDQPNPPKDAPAAPAADGVAAFHGKERSMAQRAWDWLTSIFHLDPRYAPNRPAGDMIRHQDIRRDAERKEKSDFVDEPTRPGVPAYGAAGFRGAVARAVDYMKERAATVTKVLDLTQMTKRADLNDVSKVVAEGRSAMEGTPRWAWTRGKVREALMRERGLVESDLATPDAQKAMDRAVDMVLTENVAHEIGSRIHDVKDVDRQALKVEMVRRMEEMGLTDLSSDKGKAVDSLIDHFLIAKEAGILGEKDGLSVSQLAEVMATPYLTNNESVRIDKAELTHVPMVGENMQIFYGHFHAAKQSRFSKHRDTTVSERKTAFLTAMFHDAGKNVPVGQVKTVTGVTILATSPFNPAKIPIEIKPNESLPEAVSRLKGDTAFLDQMLQANPQLKTHDEARKALDSMPLMTFVSFLFGTVVHHDSTNVLGYADATGAKTPGVIDHLVEQKIITAEEAKQMREGIQLHGWVSAWILSQSFGGMGIQSHVFLDKKYEPFKDLYIAIHGELKNGTDPRKLEESKDVPFPKGAPQSAGVPARLVGKSWKKIMAELRGEFNKLPDIVQGMFFADSMAQADIGKYMGILAGSPKNADRSVYQLIFGHQAPGMGDFNAGKHPKDADMMLNSVFGVTNTEGGGLYALNKEMGGKADQVFGNVRSWLKMHLASSVLNGIQRGRVTGADPKLKELADAYDRYAAEQKQLGHQPTVIDWLKTVQVKENGKPNPLLGTIASVVEADYYQAYRINLAPNLHVKLN